MSDSEIRSLERRILSGDADELVLERLKTLWLRTKEREEIRGLTIARQAMYPRTGDYWVTLLDVLNKVHPYSQRDSVVFEGAVVRAVSFDDSEPFHSVGDRVVYVFQEGVLGVESRLQAFTQAAYGGVPLTARDVEDVKGRVAGVTVRLGGRNMISRAGRPFIGVRVLGLVHPDEIRGLPKSVRTMLLEETTNGKLLTGMTPEAWEAWKS